MFEVSDTIFTGRNRRLPVQVAAALKEADGVTPRGPRILIVEDEYFVGLDIERWLLEANYEVIDIATTAGKAVELAKSQNPDLILMDVRLLGPRDGIEAAIDIYVEMGIRCVFATAHNDTATRARGASARPLGWLHKPFNQNELLKGVEEAMRALRR
ncbi:MAG: response regulator [Pseudolabrys sp.]|nr:response regulator [Pseudolabrys sp.]